MKSLALALLVGASLVAAGCGGGGGPVDGKVTNAGKPYAPATDGELSISLTADEGGKNYPNKVGDDGSFKLDNVPAGKYSVTATRYPVIGAERPKTPPTPKNMKLDEKWEVSGTSKSFTLEVTKMKQY